MRTTGQGGAEERRESQGAGGAGEESTHKKDKHKHWFQTGAEKDKSGGLPRDNKDGNDASPTVIPAVRRLAAGRLQRRIPSDTHPFRSISPRVLENLLLLPG